ncbi:sigma-70 family RNA polymerase sigma factor [Phytomonospora sp. NPDC050363]|uniref:RNA polymerase sigma factor n=1 Tax=Phytomonospora sp. NPDC050363 TaxID=3155642 RepID=UPI0034000A52
MTREVEDLLRSSAPRVLGALVRRYGHFPAAEDAVQEALLAASTAWAESVPDDPGAWLIRVASRRLIDQLRADQARRHREDSEALLIPRGAVSSVDDSLLLLVMCCHPALGRGAQVALTLRAVGGLTTAEIARAYLVPESTMAQRISRAKARVRQSGAGFHAPPPAEFAERLDAVREVLYLIFNEGYTSTSGERLARVELSAEAIRLARMLPADDGESAGLLALMLLTDARRAARTDTDGMLVPLSEQDRRLWSAPAIAEGTALITAAMTAHKPGPYQLQAAIAAVHNEAPGVEETDWLQILGLYRLLEAMTNNPMVTLNMAVAVGEVHGPAEGLAALDRAAGKLDRTGTHRVDAVRGHLLEMDGRLAEAAECYRAAAKATTSGPERRYLLARAVRVDH